MPGDPREGNQMQAKGKRKDGHPSKDPQKYRFVHTAILEGTAVFFCSTSFFLFPSSLLSLYIFFQINALAMWRVRLYFVGKCQFPFKIGARGPPVNLISSDFRLIGGKKRGL